MKVNVKELVSREVVVVDVVDQKHVEPIVKALKNEGYLIDRNYTVYPKIIHIDNYLHRISFFSAILIRLGEHQKVNCPILGIKSSDVISKPTKADILHQLHSIKDHSESMFTGDDDDIWEKDVEVLDIVIDFIEKTYRN